MSDSLIIHPDSIQQRLYYVRGQQSMLDKDLAELYSVKQKLFHEQVKRYSNRFPADFMFQFKDEEIDLVVSQNAIPTRQVLGGSMPYVFTQQGVAALCLDTLELRQNQTYNMIEKVLNIIEEKTRFPKQSISYKEFPNSHDRFLIIDGKDIYCIGTSLKNQGKKWFAYSTMEKSTVEILNKVKFV